MGNNLYFVVSSVILSLTLLASFYLKYKIPTKDNKILIALIWLVVLSDALDLVIGLNGVYYRIPGQILYILNTLYIIGRQLIIVGYAGYIVVSTDSVKVIPTGWKILCMLTNVYGLILIIGNLKFHWLFMADAQGNYIRGEHLYLYYIFELQLYFLVVGLNFLFHIFQYRILYIFLCLHYIGIYSKIIS